MNPILQMLAIFAAVVLLVLVPLICLERRRLDRTQAELAARDRETRPRPDLSTRKEVH